MPKVSSQFYEKALEDVKEKYADKPTDRLLRQKLYYYGKLNWPKESIDDLNKLLEKQGLDSKLVDLFLQYYLSNEQYGELSDMLDKWEFYNGLNEERSRYRVLANYYANGKEGAAKLILDYIKKFNSTSSYEFAVDQAISLGDTALLKVLFPGLRELSPQNNRLSRVYAPILFEEGQYAHSYEVLIQSGHKGNEYQVDLYLGKNLYELDSVKQAKKLISKYDKLETDLILARWYRKENSYDSSILFIDHALTKDSSRAILIMKAEVLDERGWFNSSYALFNYLIQKDTSDAIAIAKAAIVARKIAYLRNLREAETGPSEPEVLPKRTIENE